jgi:raffinose/stachyose/melibiose transport system substrate-binding protein
MPNRLPLIALLTAALCLPACGRKPPASPATPTTTATTARTTLTFWHIMNYEGPREMIDGAVLRFEAANPDVKVNVQTFDNDAYKTKLSVELAGGAPPDVFFTWGGGGLAAMAEAGRVLDLTEAVSRDGWRERFLPAALPFCAARDRVYAVPLDLSCVPVWYNAALFEKLQVTPPKTLDELQSLCRSLRERGVTPFALGNQAQWPGALFFIYLAARGGGTELFLDAAARKAGHAFTDPAFIRAGEGVRQLVEAKAFSVGFNGIDDGQARTRFLNGDAAMYLMGTWLVARAQKEKPEFLPHLKCFPFPTVPGGAGDPATVVGGVNCAFAVSKSCKRPEKAVELLRFLTAPEMAEAWCRIGRIPALAVKDDALAQLPVPTRETLALLRAAKSIQPYYDQYLPPRLAEEHKKTTQALLAGTMKPQEAAERMEKAASEK